MKINIYIIIGVILLLNIKQSCAQINEYYHHRNAQCIFNPGFNFDIKNDITLESAKLNSFIKPYKGDLKLNSMIQTRYSSHLVLKQYYQGMPIYQGQVMVNIANDGRVLSIIDNLFENHLSLSSNQNQSYNNIIFFNGEQLMYCRLDTLYINQQLTECIYSNDQIIYERTLESNLNPIDSVVKVKVFNPDPLTSSQQSYGGNYMDMNDSNLKELNDQMVFKDVILLYDSPYFKLQNDYIKIAKITSQLLFDTAFNGQVPVFGRGDINFESLNCMYHISNCHQQINQLGFNLGDDQLLVDPHGRTDDNSNFANNGSLRYIRFGDGGIDDAEDADPIIHEYHHAIFDEASQSQNVGLYRKSIEEGTCDYFTASYSKSISNYQWSRVYNWDGNATNFSGRNVITTLKFPNDLSNSNIYINGEIWADLLSQIEIDLGRETAQKLIYQSFYQASININFPDMCRILLQSDTVLNQAKNCWKLCLSMTQRNILNCATGLPNQNHLNELQILFQNEQQIMLINPTNQNLNFDILDVTGKCIFRQNLSANTELSIDKSGFSKGIYFIQFQRNDLFNRQKVLVY